MKALQLVDIITAIGVKPKKVHEGVSIVKVIHDSKHANDHTLYFHIRKKDILDGDKLKKYNHLYIVTDSPFDNMEKMKFEQIIMVEDIFSTFYKFTSYYRHMFNIPVVAITGTCGKTTTKEMLKHILQTNFTVQATIGNRNSSYFNLPYLVGITEKTDIAVIETGVAEPGDMVEACNYFFPTIGIMTMIDTDHTDEFPSFEDYVAEKEKLIHGLDEKGTLIINIDDSNISSMNFSIFKGKIITFGKSEGATFQIKESHFHKSGMEFTLIHQKKEYIAFIPGIGEHNVYNAVAAIAGAVEAGIDITASIERLASFQHLRSHFEIIQLPNQITLIDDTWKSNPPSLENGLRLLGEISVPSQRKIAVLGRMGPLGQYADEKYKKVGRLLVEIGVNKLITKGFIGKEIAKAALLAGMSKRDIHHYTDTHDVQDFLEKILKPNDIVYFKIWRDDSFGDVIKHLKNKN
ncbi:Mur ligase family protein [Bacillus sp. FJAT-27245]|uniref:Mur ligase family protein n=1 Tax=Bacillus sp. FJAT-27245 TaxID=1684144 RepID=UPI0006A78EE5|nr:UDP-N-acetylmuramoyl-tripeptide--D-alanyl-D-alanine ligase [Bacillus sp. FJAT-27245]